MARYIDADALIGEIKECKYADPHTDFRYGVNSCIDIITAGIKRMPTADVVEVEKVAEMLRTMFDDDAACNYNGNDEWLPMKCKYAETDCPMPKERLGCWKEFVKHFLAKMDLKGDHNG